MIRPAVCHPEAARPPSGVDRAATSSRWNGCGSYSRAKAMIFLGLHRPAAERNRTADLDILEVEETGHRRDASGVELEQQHVAVGDDVFLALVARLAGLLGSGFAAEGDIVGDRRWSGRG
jgi:hypothetical protein